MQRGSRFHSRISKYLRNEEADSCSCKFINILKEIISRDELCFRYSELAVSGFGLSGKIDAVFYNARHDEFVLVDWKFTSRLPAHTTVNRYEKCSAELRNSNKFFHQNISRYIMQLNIYAILFRSQMNLPDHQNVRMILYLVKENKKRVEYRRIKCFAWPLHDVLSYAHCAVLALKQIKHLSL